MLAWIMLLGLTGVQTTTTEPIERYLRVPLIPDSVALDEPGRYESPRNYKATVDFYRRIFHQKSRQWKPIANLPGVRAIHLYNGRLSNRWEGINFYETKGRVRYFIIARQTKGKQ